jgi:hypothetical protein
MHYLPEFMTRGKKKTISGSAINYNTAVPESCDVNSATGTKGAGLVTEWHFLLVQLFGRVVIAN